MDFPDVSLPPLDHEGVSVDDFDHLSGIELVLLVEVWAGGGRPVLPLLQTLLLGGFLSGAVLLRAFGDHFQGPVHDFGVSEPG